MLLTHLRRCGYALLVGLITLTGSPAGAQDVVITSGALDMLTQTGDLSLVGGHGFTFESHVSASGGSFLPAEQCNGNPLGCIPGAPLDLTAYWNGKDLSGQATLNGITYPTVGNIDGTASMIVDFQGTFVVPPLRAAAIVTAPFTLTGTFTHSSGADPGRTDFAGAGLATVFLVPHRAYLGSWLVTRVLYTLGSAPPAPWQSTDIGMIGTPGHTLLSGDTFVVSGAGADIWGTDDSFRFVSRGLDGDGAIVARVLDQSSSQPLAKAGLMMRESLDSSSAEVILDLNPDGGVEFMMRTERGNLTAYAAGAMATGEQTWLRLQRRGDLFTGSFSADAVNWAEVGSVLVPMNPSVFTGMAVTSLNLGLLNVGRFQDVEVIPRVPVLTNLLTNGDFERDVPPALTLPGWASDAMRQTPSKSEAFQPRTGLQNGACWSPDFLDCGMYQELTASTTGTYTLTVFATADRAGGLVGANLNGVLAATANVEPRDYRNYGAPYVMTLIANAGDVIRIWMYSPSAPGYVVIDDVSLTAGAGPASSPSTSLPGVTPP